MVVLRSSYIDYAIRKAAYEVVVDAEKKSEEQNKQRQGNTTRYRRPSARGRRR